MIEHLSNFPDDVLAFVCKGRVTKADYDSVLVPAVVKALEKQKRVRLYYETAADFSGRCCRDFGWNLVFSVISSVAMLADHAARSMI
jgi:hypothetical protein